MADERILVFDRPTLRRRRERAAAEFDAHDFLVAEVADRLADRLDDVKRSFPLALDLGCHAGTFASQVGPRGGIETLIQADLAPAMARRAADAPSAIRHRPVLAADEEFLPFAERSFDLAVSGMALHWANDLPGALLQINHALKPDGLFLAALPGGETLHELRHALLLAESELEGGAGPRVSPFAELQDATALLQRAGFALPVSDVDTITVTYPDPLRLMADLRGMGQSNAVRDRRRAWTRRGTLLRAAELYREIYGTPDGRVPATFQILFLTGWRPDASQPLPLRPGDAQARLAAALGTEEIPTGVKAAPPGHDTGGG